jgi:hypothetical protein
METITASNVRDLVTKGTELTRTSIRTEYLHDPKTYRVSPVPVRHVERLEVTGLRRWKTGRTRLYVTVTTSVGSTYGCALDFTPGAPQPEGLELAA